MNDINLQLTTAGQALNAKIQLGSGTIPLEITRIVTGSGTSPDPLNLTNVVDEQQEFVITGRTVSGTRAIINTMLTNFGNPPDIPPLTQGYNLSQVGIYAMDPDEGEVLYRISQFENSNWVPALSERPWELMLEFSFTVGNASEVVIEINPSGFVTKGEVENLLQGFSPRPHSSPTPEHGLGNGANFGHLRLSDEINLDSGVSGGIAATPLAVRNLGQNLNDAIQAGLSGINLSNLDVPVSSRAPANTALSNAVWTAGRAASLDNLDASVSSRAPASTALSSAVWTAGRAAFLDRLDAAVSSRAPANTALSNAIWTADRAASMDRLTTIGGLRVFEAWEPGTYTLQIPSGVTQILVTGCGGGGDCIIRKPFPVTPLSTLTITVGAGGWGGAPGAIESIPQQTGGATIIQGIVTLPGGGGTAGSFGVRGGPGGGNGSRSFISPAAAGSGGGSYGGGAGRLIGGQDAGGAGLGALGGMGFVLFVHPSATHAGGFGMGLPGETATTGWGARGGTGGGGCGAHGHGSGGNGGNGFIRIEF